MLHPLPTANPNPLPVDLTVEKLHEIVSQRAQPKESVGREWTMCDVCHLGFRSFNTVVDRTAYLAVCQELETRKKVALEYITENEKLRKERDAEKTLREMVEANRAQLRIDKAELERERDRLKSALEKIVSYDKRLPDFTDNPQTMMAHEALKESK